MKKYLILAVVVIALVVIGGYFFLFGRKDVCKSVIPENAKAVMVLDAKQLASQLDINITDIIRFLQSDKNEKTGIDVLSPMYGFLSSEGYMCGVLPLSDADDMEDFLKEKKVEVESQRGFRWAYTAQMLLCFDDKKALALGPISQVESHNMRPRMVEWMEQGSSKSPLLPSVLDQDGALRLCSKMSVVPSSYMQQALQYLNNPFDMDKVFLNATLGVEDKALHLSTSIQSEEEEMQQLLSQHNSIFRPIQANRLKSSVSDPVVWVGFNANGDSLLVELRKNALVRMFLMGVNLCMDADMLIKSIDGDVSLELSAPSEYTLKAQVTKQDFLKNVSDWSTGFLHKSYSFKPVDKNNFVLQGDGKNTYFGVIDNQVYVSTNQNVTKLSENNASDDFVTRYNSQIQGKLFYASVSINKLTRFREVQNMMSDDAKKFYYFLDKTDRLTVSAKDYLHYDIELTTKDNISDFIKLLLK